MDKLPRKEPSKKVYLPEYFELKHYIHDFMLQAMKSFQLMDNPYKDCVTTTQLFCSSLSKLGSFICFWEEDYRSQDRVKWPSNPQPLNGMWTSHQQLSRNVPKTYFIAFSCNRMNFIAFDF